MAQQTAVDWLIQQVNSEQYQIAFGQTYISIDLIEQAKQMEKEHIMESFLDGVYEGSPTDEDYENCKVSGEQYYNKIYNK